MTYILVLDPKRGDVTECKTLEEASRKARAYITFEDLTSRDWLGGQVYQQVATVAYNGRVFDMQDKEVT